MKTRRRKFGGLFWRMALSYLAVSVVATLIAIPASRYEGPFDFLRDSDLVHTFNRFFDNQTNGTFLIIAVIALIGLVTGALISANLRGRIVRIAAAARDVEPGRFLVASARPEQRRAWATRARPQPHGGADPDDCWPRVRRWPWWRSATGWRVTCTTP